MADQHAAVIQKQASIKQRYLAYLAKTIARQQRYPKRSRSRNEEGTVKVRLVIDANGTLTSVSVTDGSGFMRLDREALKMVKRAAPFNAIPTELERSQLTLVIPIAFKLSTN